MTDKLECVIHRKEIKPVRTSPRKISRITAESTIVPLTQDKWEKIIHVANVRKQTKKFDSSVYKEIIEKLPNDIPNNGGYHSMCYSSFTALPKALSFEVVSPTPSTSDSKAHLLRADGSKLQTSSSGVFEKKCIFCKKLLKKVKGKQQLLTKCSLDSAEDYIKRIIKEAGDDRLHTTVGNETFHGKEICYHNKCRQDYTNSVNRAAKVRESRESAIEEAYSELFADIQHSVLDAHQPITAKDLHEQFISKCQNKEVKKELVSQQRTVVQRTLQHFGEKMKVYVKSKKSGTVLYDATLKPEAVPLLLQSYDFSAEQDFVLVKAARHLRQTLLNVKSSCDPLPRALTSQNFSQGQAVVPEQCIQFFREVLCTDPSSPTKKETRIASSLSSDLLYNVTKGYVKPAKHLSMGVGIKSITGSEKVCDILHKFGHSISCSHEKEITTEIGEEISRKRKAMPDGLYRESGLATSIAWDNYDELTDSIVAGLQATHDSMGVVYQNRKPQGAAPPHQLAAVDTDGAPPAKRRRRYVGQGEPQVAPYRKTPKATKFNFKSYKAITPASLEKAKLLDNLWLFQLYSSSTSPMWRGWNALTTVDRLAVQNVGYMENIELPPTRLDVVQLTMMKSDEVRKECGEKYIIAAYDLAIAKPAMRIQEEEEPRFDKLFIEMGPFHLRSSYFAGVGYYITSSGLDELLCASEVLGSGSVSGFLSGKHFNRCTRVHPLLFAALSGLHVQEFLNSQYDGSVPEQVKLELECISQQPSNELVEESLKNGETVLVKFLEEYEKYSDLTRNGNHGDTAQYTQQYMDMVHHDMLLDRSLRTNDVDLYTYSLDKVLPIFWASNRPNYKRWAVKMFLRLVNREDTHPGITEYIDLGALSVRRTKKNFSRTAHDITLEQTANRDAASRQTGISSFTTNASGRKRWCVTRAARSSVVSNLCEMAGLQQKDEGAQECRHARVKKDRDDIKRLTEAIKETMNPFSQDLEPDKLFSFSTGVALKSEIAKDLINFSQIGEAWMNAFIQECKAKPVRFEEPIKKRRVKNFADDGMKVQMRGKDLKIIELKFSRDLFAQILLLSQNQSIALKHILTYPLTPAPLALAHINGTMGVTNKAALVHKLEAKTKPVKDVMAEAVIIDFMFLLRSSASHLPLRYGDIARTLLSKALQFKARTIMLVADIYDGNPSIKDSCRVGRGVVSGKTYTKFNHRQKRPSDISCALKSLNYINSFFEFLRDEWASERCVDLITGHDLHFAYGPCYTYLVDEDVVSRIEMGEFKVHGHREADTMMVYFACHLSATKNVVLIRADDADVFILLLHHQSHMSRGSKIFIDMGLSSKNNRRIFNITELAASLGPEICATLPAFHAWTGCDYTAAFNRKGKARPYEWMVKDKESRDALSKLGGSPNVPDTVKGSLNRFTCILYGQKGKCAEVNQARLKILQDKLPSRKSKQSLKKVKSFDPASLPPCSRVLDQKINRVNCVSHIWLNAHKANIREWDPCKHGWMKEKETGRLVPDWFEGEQVPEDLFYEEESEGEDDASDEEDEGVGDQSDGSKSESSDDKSASDTDSDDDCFL